MISVLMAGFLVSNPLRDMHADVARIPFGPIDTVFTAGLVRRRPPFSPPHEVLTQ
jgi:hypothetical protein